MSYTKKDFIEDVKKEARALRKHATKEELANLDIKSFMPQDEELCVYGQLTGTCFSDRAHKLIKSCCIRLVDNEIFMPASDPNSVYDAINGKPRSIRHLNETRRRFTPNYLSTLEAYILLPDAQNKNLIAYLKGETNELNL